MQKITKDSLQEFLHLYHDFHDSYITQIHYDVIQSKIDLLLNLLWVGEPILKDNNTYQTSHVIMRLVFDGIERAVIKEMFSWDYINGIFFEYIRLGYKEYLCFATDKNDPSLYIVCENIEYEEMKE